MVSKRIGKTQQRILDELATTDVLTLTATELAARTGIPDRQVRRAVYALQARGLVVLTQESDGGRGAGEYGPRPWQQRMIDDPAGKHTRYEGSHWGIPQPGDKLGAGQRDDGTCWILGTPVHYRIEWYRGEPVGMPVGVALFVWLPENRALWARRRAQSAALGGSS